MDQKSIDHWAAAVVQTTLDRLGGGEGTPIAERMGDNADNWVWLRRNLKQRVRDILTNYEELPVGWEREGEFTSVAYEWLRQNSPDVPVDGAVIKD
jgi:hypothetical protein